MAIVAPNPPTVPLEEPTYKPHEIEPIPGDIDYPATPPIEEPPTPEIQLQR